MGKFILEFIIQVLPSIVCILAATLLMVQYFKTRDKDWLYFIFTLGFYIFGEFSTNVFDKIINFHIDILFYFCFYASVFIYLRKRKKSLIKNPYWKNDFPSELFIPLIVDFFTVSLLAFLIFYCFDREVLKAVIDYKITALTLSSFLYSVLDFFLFGYYTYLSKNFIMNDKKVYPYLAIGFILWMIGDLIYAFEAICKNETYQIGGILMVFGLLTFMLVAIKVKVSMDSSDYTTIDLFLDSSKFNHLTIIMIGLIYIYLAVYLYCYLNFKDNIFFMDTVETCGVGLLLLSTARHNIKSFYSYQRINELEKDASIDPLTGIYTRRYAFNLMKSIYKASKHFKMEISALMLDIDHFKKYNDTWGHACGDQILRDIAQLISSSIDTSNIMCRYGGEEILVVMPGVGRNEGIAIAEDIRKNVEKYSFYGENVQPIGKVTISIGGATSDNDTEDEFELIKKADTALYESKKNRNCCSWVDNNSIIDNNYIN